MPEPLTRDPCRECGGSGLVPLPRGMSSGFYSFMAAGCERRPDGTLLMVCPKCQEGEPCPEL
jgi:hypothetical protein